MALLVKDQGQGQATSLEAININLEVSKGLEWIITRKRGGRKNICL